jgi:hypothetical protein
MEEAVWGKRAWTRARDTGLAAAAPYRHLTCELLLAGCGDELADHKVAIGALGQLQELRGQLLQHHLSV